MIDSLYDCFKHWAGTGSVYIIADTHFDNPDCKLIDPEWPSPQDYIAKLKKKITKNDTLIHLGDVGNPEYLKELKCYKVLIKGNHDKKEQEAVFDEGYTGPLFIGERILLSHAPIFNLERWCCNIHGHNHAAANKLYCTSNLNHTNLAANVYNYEIFDLGKEIKKGLLSNINNFNRWTINEAIKQKRVQNLIDELNEGRFYTFFDV